MQTRSQGLKFFTTEQDLYSPKGNLDILPHHIRMQIYRIHIQNTRDASVMVITQTCRGIYAEIHKQMRDEMIDRVYSKKTLFIVSGPDVFDKNLNLRILSIKGVRYGLTLRNKEHYIFPTFGDTKGVSDILGILTSLEVRLALHDWVFWEPMKSPMAQMLRHLSSELVRLEELRIHSTYMLGHHWNEYDDYDEGAMQNLYIVLENFLLIPTVRQVRLIGSLYYLPKTKRILFSLLDHLQIEYEVVSEWDMEEELYKLYK